MQDEFLEIGEQSEWVIAFWTHLPGALSVVWFLATVILLVKFRHWSTLLVAFGSLLQAVSSVASPFAQYEEFSFESLEEGGSGLGFSMTPFWEAITSVGWPGYVITCVGLVWFVLVMPSAVKK